MNHLNPTVIYSYIPNYFSQKSDIFSTKINKQIRARCAKGIQLCKYRDKQVLQTISAINMRGQHKIDQVQNNFGLGQAVGGAKE